MSSSLRLRLASAAGEEEDALATLCAVCSSTCRPCSRACLLCSATCRVREAARAALLCRRDCSGDAVGLRGGRRRLNGSRVFIAEPARCWLLMEEDVDRCPVG